MATALRTVLVVGAAGGIRRLVVAESIARGHTTRALVRDAARARGRLPAEAQIAVADVAQPGTLPVAVAGVDAIVLTHGPPSPPAPGWFDMNGPDERRLVFLQADTRRSPGVIARDQIARVSRARRPRCRPGTCASAPSLPIPHMHASTHNDRNTQ
ncbi:NAD(P)-dependent dehydrogenase (short-subunit alcohol dehydrogenase family) [Nonomuraea muscovyensis]|uniref:NAD(P)-dependent dehydrogenase (Short-subunit alcohol dehydrogenase family) n=1 Tax=Nonomuraea muscovyensis TaxID=1124761 RepID=A0A7X0C5U8_9ACTN|nr:NAD(P)H-binding protein [Nonomuraea muscovyensis]MBB6347666.1 NAD(P)-dependent dehydrogenase (short-subunit alcohol dehydrogenase family) [Nonomuraea muscovyensis]